MTYCSKGVFGRVYSTGTRGILGGGTELTDVSGTGIIEVVTEPTEASGTGIEFVPNNTEQIPPVRFFTYPAEHISVFGMR